MEFNGVAGGAFTWPEIARDTNGAEFSLSRFRSYHISPYLGIFFYWEKGPPRADTFALDRPMYRIPCHVFRLVEYRTSTRYIIRYLKGSIFHTPKDIGRKRAICMHSERGNRVLVYLFVLITVLQETCPGLKFWPIHSPQGRISRPAVMVFISRPHA